MVLDNGAAGHIGPERYFTGVVDRGLLNGRIGPSRVYKYAPAECAPNFEHHVAGSVYPEGRAEGAVGSTPSPRRGIAFERTADSGGF
jgi:hypothetical protein